MENKSFGQNRMGNCPEGSQEQIQRAIVQKKKKKKKKERKNVQIYFLNSGQITPILC
jgi:hypothetical protein